MADNITNLFQSQGFVPLPEPTVLASPDSETSRADVLNSIADLVDDNGQVNIDAIPAADESAAAMLTAGTLDLEGEDPFVGSANEIVSNPDMTQQEKFSALNALEVARQDGERPEVKARTTMIAFEEEGAENFKQQRRARIVGDQIQQANSMQRILSETRDEISDLFPEGQYVERGAEFVASEILPTGWIKSGHFDPAFLAQELTGIDIGAADIALFGSKLAEAREQWKTFSPEEQVRRANSARSYIIERQGTFGTDNKWEADRLYSVFAGIVGDAKQFDEAKQLTFYEPLINLATLGAGGAIFRTLKGAVKTSPVKIAAEVAPDASEPMVRAAVSDVSGETADAVGAQRAEIIEDYVLHNTKDDPVLRGPDIREGTSDVQEVTDQILRLRNQHNLASEAEIADATERLLDKVPDQANVVQSKSKLWRDNDHTLKAQYVLKPDDGPEFTSFRDAQEFIGKSLEPFQLDGARILQYNAAKEQYLPVEKIQDIDAPGGFLVEVDYRQTLNSIAKPEDVFRDGKRVTWLDGHLDTTVTFNDRIASGVTGVELTTGQVDTILTNVIKPYKNVNRTTQLRVNEVLKAGSEARKEFTDAELIKHLDGDQGAINAYKAVRKVYSINYNLRNVQLRDHLQSAGYQQLRYGADSKSFLKRTPDTARPDTAWDAKSGSMVKVTDNMDVYSTFSPLKYTDNAGEIAAASHVVVSPERLAPLSTQVLPRLDGYLGTHLDAKWLVKKRTIGSNGQPIDQVLRFGTDSTALRKWIAEQGDDSLDLFPTRERETGQYSVQGEAELLADLEMLGHTKARSDLDKLNDNYKKHLLDPDEAVAKDITTMARQAGLQETTKYLVNKWSKSYGDLSVDGQMPWGKFEPVAGLNTEQRARVPQAKALHQRIKIMSGMDDETLAGRFKTHLLTTADSFSKMAIDLNKADPTGRVKKVRSQLAGAVAKSAETVSDFDPVAKIKNLNFLQFIVFHPARQAVLQSATSTLYVGVEGGIKYAKSGKWGLDMSYLAAGKMFSGNEKAFTAATKSYAKARGISPAEAKNFFDEVEGSGLLQSISHHQYMEYASANVISSRIKPRALIKAAESGFKAGESTNLLSAYTVVRNRQVDKLGRNVLTEAEARDLAIEAKQLAGNMGASNKAAFQQGLMGVPFQFMSHNVKMLQIMAPTKGFLKGLSMPVVTNREKLRIGAAYSLMWGTGGLAVTGLVTEATSEAGIPLDDKVTEVIDEGLIGWSIESAFEALGGDEADIDVSSSFGALAGLAGDIDITDGQSATPIGAVAEFMHSTLMERSPPLNDLLGASGRLLDDPTGAISDAVMLWDSPAFSTGEKLRVQMQNMSTFFPFINEAYQARAAAKVGQWVNSQGDPVTEASFSEALAKGVLGIEPSAKESIYNLRTKIEGRTAVDKEASWSEIKRSGKDQARFIASASAALDRGALNKEEFFDRVQHTMAVAKITYDDPVQFNVFKRSMRKEVEAIMKAQGTTIEEGLIRKLMKDKWLQGEKSFAQMQTELLKLPPSEHRDYALQNLPHWFGAGSATGGPLDAREE